MSVVAALLLAGAAAVLVRPRFALPRPSGHLPRTLLGLLVLLLVVAAWSVLDLHDFLLALVAGLVALAVARILARRRAAKAAEERAERVMGLCDAMSSDLAAGQPPLTALERAGSEWPEFAPVAVAGRMGADVPDLLRELAGLPGAGQLRVVAATWQVAHDTGSGLATALGQAADAIRADRRTARLVAGELAAAHATARMLAVLPIGVLLLGTGVGGDPVGFLLRTTPGLVLLAAGLGLSFAGLTWLERIADRVLGRR